MKKFISKIVLFLTPIVVLLVVAEILLRNIPNDYSYKNDYLKKNAGNIETLFLGSSHAYYGINPEYFSANSFNASHISQTIDLDYEIIKKYSLDLKSLKYLVIPIDYFTLLSRTSTGVESWRMKNYNIYYNLNTSNNPFDNLEIFSFSLMKNTNRIIGYYLRNVDHKSCSKLGYGNMERKQADLTKTGKAASKRHTKKNKKYLNESIKIIDKIISYGEGNNVTILFYTSPAFYTYRQNLDSTQYHSTINIIDSICNSHKNSFYFNFIADSSFIADDFRDADHLNKNGAKKLTLKIKGIIDSVEHNSSHHKLNTQ